MNWWQTLLSTCLHNSLLQFIQQNYVSLSFSCSQVSSSSGPDGPGSLCPVVDLQWHRLPRHDGQHTRLDMRSQSRWQEGNEKHVSLPLQPCPSLTALKWAVAWLTAIIWPICLILVATGHQHHMRWTWNNSDMPRYFAFPFALWESRGTETSVRKQAEEHFSLCDEDNEERWSEGGEEGLHRGLISITVHSTAGIADDAYGDALHCINL